MSLNSTVALFQLRFVCAGLSSHWKKSCDIGMKASCRTRMKNHVTYERMKSQVTYERMGDPTHGVVTVCRLLKMKGLFRKKDL